jgi:hypothetical protein
MHEVTACMIASATLKQYFTFRIIIITTAHGCFTVIIIFSDFFSQRSPTSIFSRTPRFECSNPSRTVAGATYKTILREFILITVTVYRMTLEQYHNTYGQYSRSMVVVVTGYSKEKKPALRILRQLIKI